MKRIAGCIIALLVVLAVGGGSPARSEEVEGAEGGVSGYAVARVKVLDGSVWVRPSDGGDWEEFPGNSPLPPRSRVSVPEGSEAELQFHGGQFVLLTSGTDLEVRDLQNGRSVFRLRAGEIRFDLPPEDFAPVSVRVPGGAQARFPEPGRHWLTVTESGETLLVVRRGKAVVTLEDDEHLLSAGQQAVIGREVIVGWYRGGADESVETPPPPEGEAQGVAPPVVTNELREYGEWISVPAYGTVWRPRVAVGWSPYVYGRWVWISPYGWTWVSSEPWGWYPYRCGFWLTDPVFGWIWSPYNSFVSVTFYSGSNRYYHHNVYFRPATVRFIPEGREVRWVPLRPGERYRPVEFRRDDSRLAGWNRPLDNGRVFVRGGPDRREWRDYNAVHAERQVEIRKTRAAQPRPDTRTVRPERRGSVPPSAVERKRSAEPPKKEKAVTREGKTVRPDRGTGATRESAPAPTKAEKIAPPPRSTPALPPARTKVRETVPRDDRPERGTGATREPVPAPAKVEKVAPSPRIPPARPDAGRGVVQEQAPVVRTPDAGRKEVQERTPAVVRTPDAGSGRDGGDRGDQGGGRGGDRGGDRRGDRGDAQGRGR